MPKPTSSRDRSKRTASKRPTSSATRATRSRASTNSQRVTASGGGKFGSARVTRDARRPSGTGAKVTGGTQPSRPALPPAGRGGALATRPSSALVSPNRPEPQRGGPRPGGRTVVDESPRLPQGRVGGSVSPKPAGRGGSTTSGRIAPVRVGEAPRPQIGGSGSRLALPSGRSGGALSRAASGAAGSLTKAGRGGFPLGAALALPFAAANVVEQGRRTGAAWNRMVAPNKANTGRRQANDPYGVSSRLQRGGPMADIRGTGRQVAGSPVNRAPEAPKPARPTQGTGGGSSAPSSSRSSAYSQGTRGSSRTAPSQRPAASSSSASTASGKTPAEMAATDSWSINFLRQRRGLPSLSKGARPQGSGDVAQGDLGTRSQDERGYTMASLGLDDKKKRK